jgi:hypothetical protein
MKERTIFDDEFEKQLKEKADQFKMYPSDKVWNEVYSSIHTRRRKFVTGMSFLIGSILLLAGAQLIFPSKNTVQKVISAKINTPVKSATAADLSRFAANGLAPSADNSADVRKPDGNLNAPPSFVLRSELSSEMRTGTETKLESLPEKIQTTGSVKPIQSADPNASAKSTAPPATRDLNDNSQSGQISYEINKVTADMLPEKSVTQLSHIRNDRFSWELFITPTLNKHYLYGLNAQTMTQSIQTAPIRVGYFTNVNGLVDNTPVVGYDVGGNILYRVSKFISLKAGLEFSFSRYYIKAYNSDQPQASPVLSSYLGYVSDSLVSINTGNGTTINKNPQRFQNRYYQISLPVGVEMKVAGKGRLQLHLGGTLQPSYLLNTDAYVLSDDYITYVKNSQAFRRWNLIAGAEAHISYDFGKMRLELGPQVRYQIFSTYKNSYPLQENMLNYGIRIGISRSIR